MIPQPWLISLGKEHPLAAYHIRSLESLQKTIRHALSVPKERKEKKSMDHNTFALFVNCKGQLVKVINGTDVVCSDQQSLEIAKAIFEKNGMTVQELPNTILRENSLALEQKEGGYHKSVPLVDLLNPKWKNIRGTYRFAIDFVPDQESGKDKTV